MGAFDPHILIKAFILLFSVVFQIMELFVSFDKGQGICLSSSLPDFLLCCLIHVVFNILPKSAIEKNRLLAYYSNFAPQVMHVVVLYVYAIYRDLARFGHIEPLKELQYGGFATP